MTATTSLCRRRLETALGQWKENTELSTITDTVEEEKWVERICQVRGPQYRTHALRGQGGAKAPTTGIQVTITCNMWSEGNGRNISLLPNGDVFLSRETTYWVIQSLSINDDDPDPVPTITIHSSVDRLQLCVDNNFNVIAAPPSVHPRENYHFATFIDAERATDSEEPKYLLSPKVCKGYALRGGLEGKVDLYQFKSGRSFTKWAEGRSGAIDDFRCPNTCEWMMVPKPTLTQSQGNVVLVENAERHQQLGLEGPNQLFSFRSVLSGKLLSLPTNGELCVASSSQATPLEQFTTEYLEDRWVLSSDTTSKTATFMIILARRCEGSEVVFLLYNSSLQYLNCSRGQLTLSDRPCEESLWDVDTYVQLSLTQLHGKLRRQIGVFPAKGSSKADLDAVRSDTQARIATRKAASEAADAAAQLEEQTLLSLKKRCKMLQQHPLSNPI